ncbi:YiaA/YiaB family inner membrane protein, partial [Acinetobacter baumannii]
MSADPSTICPRSTIGRKRSVRNNHSHSAAWVNFTYLSFGVSLFLVAAGVFFMPVDIWIKGYLGMGVALL